MYLKFWTESYLEERKKVVKFLARCSAVEKHTACLQHRGHKSNAEEVVRGVERAIFTRNRGAAYGTNQ
jgi:hypothetical protein